MKESLNRFFRDFFAALVGFYQAHLKWFVVGDCKYHPSCSEYALEALRTEKTPKAAYLIFSRLIRCHPWSQGGFDPPRKEKHHVC